MAKLGGISLAASPAKSSATAIAAIQPASANTSRTSPRQMPISAESPTTAMSA